jgi:hypothetical protein
LGALRGQDTDLATSNANIINQFNMANTAERNRVNQANVGLTNQQSTMNTQQNNAYQKYLAEKQQEARQQEFQNKIGQAGMAAGESNNLAAANYGAGMTGVALGQNTGAQIANGLGGAAQGIYQSVHNNANSGNGADSSDGWSAFQKNSGMTGSDAPSQSTAWDEKDQEMA